MLWPSDIQHIGELRGESLTWRARAEQAKWEYQAILFSGYVSQWVRWKQYASEADRAARAVMGITDNDQNYS